jgi:hypothetical protein
MRRLPRPYNNCFNDHEAGSQGASAAAQPARINTLVELYTKVSPLALKRQIDRRLAAMRVQLEVEISA